MRWCKSVLRSISFTLLLCSCLSVKAQDSLYTRQVIKKLTSKEFYGRGYLNDGLDKAAKYIAKELKKFDAVPLFYTGYFQWFDFNVNTFPGKMDAKINGKTLKPGIDFIVSEESAGIKRKFIVDKKQLN